ncbi:hypothetical protein HanPI659440_Chr06g0229301 [Helianthus annuus]|nr:hypothetical protein HanPI659440_Chr06g0229291 [Helianthus annuus]KAJ0779690.1 hypothetical protein HanPI659440_Chr06g0229301 [Helianthus annuus]
MYSIIQHQSFTFNAKGSLGLFKIITLFKLWILFSSYMVWLLLILCWILAFMLLLMIDWFLFLELVVDSRSVYFRLKRIETLTQGFKCCLNVLGNFWLVTDLLRSMISW